MTGSRAERVVAAVTDVVERVFDTVADVHTAAVRQLLPGVPEGPAAGLEDVARTLLGRADQLAVGLGLIVAPRPENDFRLRLHWWQVDPGSGRLRALDPDLRPSSLGFYDYTATDWFDVPRRTGLRHVVGPYVDVHGTGRYLLTLTGPVLASGEFLGVVGADVPVSRFEGHLLQVLGSVEEPFFLLNDEGRVVLSTSPRWLVGALLRSPADLPGVGSPLAGIPWRLYLADPTDRLLSV